MPDTQQDYPYANVPHMRVLYCYSCRTFDEIPDFEGPADRDDELNYVVNKHGPSHNGQLYRLPIGFWLQEKARKQIMDQIRGGSSGLAEFDSSYYDTRNIFVDDAMACFRQHRRPKESCPDWRHSSKALRPDTMAERKDLGLSTELSGPKRYLCDFCPVRSYYERKSRGE